MPSHWSPPTVLSRPQVQLPALHQQLPLQRSQLSSFGHTFLAFHPGVVKRSKDRWNEECEKIATLHLVDKVKGVHHVLVGFPRIANDEGHYREPVVLIQHSKSFQNDAGPVLNWEGNTFTRHDLLSHPNRAGLEAYQRR